MSEVTNTNVSPIQTAVIGYAAKLKMSTDVRDLIIIVRSNNVQVYWTHLL